MIFFFFFGSKVLFIFLFREPNSISKIFGPKMTGNGKVPEILRMLRRFFQSCQSKTANSWTISRKNYLIFKYLYLRDGWKLLVNICLTVNPLHSTTSLAKGTFLSYQPSSNYQSDLIGHNMIWNTIWFFLTSDLRYKINGGIWFLREVRHVTSFLVSVLTQ